VAVGAALLDVDGTLIDSNYQHALAWFRAFREHGFVLPVWRIHRAVGGLHHQALRRVGEDLADEAVIVRALAEGDLGRDEPRRIFVIGGAKAAVDMGSKRLAGIDLVTGNPDVHERLQLVPGRG